jgi:adenylosuccinate lyase
LKISSEDDWTYFPEFTLYAQIAIGSIPSKDVAYKMIGNEAFMEKDIQDTKKFISAAREINRMVEAHINEVYQDYVDENDELVRFYKQGLSEHGLPKV